MNAKDRFSLKRLRLVAGLYSSAVGRRLVVYASISAIAGAMFLIYAFADTGVMAILMLMPVLYLAQCLAPLALAPGKGLVMRVALPATPCEKSLVPLLYAFVAVPLAIFAPFCICVALGGHYAAQASLDLVLFLHLVATYFCANPAYCLLAPAVLTGVCLFGIVTFGRRTTANTLLAVFVAWLVLVGIDAIGFGLMLHGLYERGVIGHSVYSVDSNAQIYRDLAETIVSWPDLIGGHSVFALCENVALAAVLAALVWAVYRSIKNRQI